MLPDLTWENLKKRLGGTYSEEDLRDALDDVIELTEDGKLFTKDEFEYLVPIVKKRKTVVKALCLHIAHDCNLACRYCFAEEGEYHGRRALMSYEVGKKALDFLIANSVCYQIFDNLPVHKWLSSKEIYFQISSASGMCDQEIECLLSDLHLRRTAFF